MTCLFVSYFATSKPDLSKNNITLITEDNFKGQQNLRELNLAKNKMDQVPSATFKYLTVSQYSNREDKLLLYLFFFLVPPYRI